VAEATRGRGTIPGCAGDRCSTIMSGRAVLRILCGPWASIVLTVWARTRALATLENLIFGKIWGNMLCL
jgi:hypothetical protein